MKKIILFFFLIILTNSSFSETQTSLQPLFNLMAKRAELMKEVAAYKWANNHDASAYNADQEIKVLQNGEVLAQENNLNTQSLLVFIQIQMDLSKQIEDYWINYWNNTKMPKSALPSRDSIISLNKLREAIKTIDDQLYPEISRNINLIKDTPNAELMNLIQSSFVDFEGEPIKGIPYKNPDYLTLLVSSLKDI